MGIFPGLYRHVAGREVRHALFSLLVFFLAGGCWLDDIEVIVSPKRCHFDGVYALQFEGCGNPPVQRWLARGKRNVECKNDVTELQGVLHAIADCVETDPVEFCEGTATMEDGCVSQFTIERESP